MFKASLDGIGITPCEVAHEASPAFCDFLRHCSVPEQCKNKALLDTNLLGHTAPWALSSTYAKKAFSGIFFKTEVI